MILLAKIAQLTSTDVCSLHVTSTTYSKITDKVVIYLC